MSDFLIINTIVKTAFGSYSSARRTPLPALTHPPKNQAYHSAVSFFLLTIETLLVGKKRILYS